MSTDDVPIYSYCVSVGQWMRVQRIFHGAACWLYLDFHPPSHLLRSSVTTLTSIIGVISPGSKTSTLGKLPVSPSRIHDKHKHLHPRRFRAFSFAFLGTSKTRVTPVTTLQDMDHGLTAFPHCSHTFPFSCTEISMLLPFMPLPSIAAGCATINRWSR